MSTQNTSGKVVVITGASSGFGDSLRQEVTQSDLKNVHICTVMPTAHDTPFFDHVANYTGHEIQAPAPLRDPEYVVETIVRLVHDPEDKEIGGGDGFVKIAMKKLAPGGRKGWPRSRCTGCRWTRHRRRAIRLAPCARRCARARRPVRAG